MKKYNKVLLLIILSVSFIFVLGTLAYAVWSSDEADRTNVVFSIDEGYSCAADGGGDITNNEAVIAPSSCTNSKYAIKRELLVTPTIIDDSIIVEMDLWLDINELGAGLSESENFRYALTTSSISCDGSDGEVIASGNFNNLVKGDKVYLLNEKIYTDTVVDRYYLYIWLDAAEKSVVTQNQIFNLSLGGSCNGDSKLDLEYNVINISNNNSDTLDLGLYYTLSNYTCKNGTRLSYDAYSRKITANGIDKCNLEFTQTANPKLYDVVEIGDYISYIGDSSNGCTTSTCSGFNANQTTSEIGRYSNYGYCDSSIYKFYTYGWRVLYKDSTDNTIYIVSAGAPECVTGTSSDSTATITSLKTAALKYCNNKYLSGGVCNVTTAHPFNGDDFYKFTSQYYGSSNARYLYNYNDGGAYGSPHCYNVYSNKYCGYSNDLVDIGGQYWFGSALSAFGALSWGPADRRITSGGNGTINGLRPVLKLDSSIQVINGLGTLTSPYQISERITS